MPYGSVVAKFRKISLATADNRHYDFELNFLNRLAVRIVGLPHLGFRCRANLIFGLIRNLRVNKNARILDAGCGYGIYSFMLAQKGYCVDCIDLSGRRISSIKERLAEFGPFSNRIFPEIGSLTHLPYRDCQFELVICSEVIEHMVDDSSAVRELTRVLAPGGALILTTPTASKQNQKVYKSFGHERPGYTDKEYYNFAKENNLELDELLHYEYKIGSSMFIMHQLVTNKILMGLLFYPLYLFSLIDLALQFGEPNGVVGLFRKPEY